MKKFNAFILCLLLLITCGLTGCAGFEVNRVKYYNETVATVGDTHITRYELLSAYNSYGSSYYVDQQGKTEKEAMAETLNLLMDRESLYQYAHSQAEYKPTAYQVNTAIEELFDSIDSTMADYVKQAKRILNVKIEEADDSSSDSETAYKYADYNTVLKGKRAELKTKTVYYTDDSKETVSTTPTEFAETVDYIVYIEQEEPSFDCVLGSGRMSALSDYESDATLELVISTYFDKFNTSLENEEKQTQIYNKAVALLCQDLISSEKYLRDANGKEFNTVNKDLIKRYFKKAYDDKIKSLYLTNVRTNYLKNASNELSITALLDKYVSLVRTSYNKYANNIESYKSAMKDVGTKADDILYHPTLNDGNSENADTKFGYFIHTLIKFSDDQTTAIKNLDKAKNIYNLSDAQYRAQYDAIVAETTAKTRNATTGLIDEDAEAVTLSQVLAEYDTISSLDEFVTFMFKYSEDTATLTQGMPYVVGTNGYSAMETAFTNEAVRLMTTSAPGAMTSSTTNTDSKNGDVMCITSYGIHLLYYVGEVDMFDVSFGEIESAYISTVDKEGNSNNLYKKEINPLTHQTYFDKLFDLVYPASSSTDVYANSNGYTAKENELIAQMRKTNPAHIYKTKLDATKTSL